MREARTPEAVESVSELLGLHPEVLQAARERYLATVRDAAVQPAMGRKRARSGHVQLEVYFPKATWEQWQDYAASLGLTSPAALRSLFHAYLLGSWEPRWRSSYWPDSDGGFIRLNYRPWEIKHKKRWPYVEKALVTRGSVEAFARRCQRLNLPRQAALRGIVLEALAGAVVSVMPIDCRAMPDDADRYPMPPLPRKKDP